MRMWLLTWECNTSKVKEEFVAVLSSRKSDSSIAELAEYIVLRATSNAQSLAYYANRRRELVNKALTPLNINNIPHSNRILCGHDPWLYARIVTEFKVIDDDLSNEEIISWREPDDFRLSDTSPSNTEVAKRGDKKILRRKNRAVSSPYQ